MEPAWKDTNERIDFKDSEKKFEDNFVSIETEEFKKLDDSSDYIKILGKFQ
jgi:hypothetical protein